MYTNQSDKIKLPGVRNSRPEIYSFNQNQIGFTCSNITQPWLTNRSNNN